MPGTLRLQIEIEYLREMFDEPGISFAVELNNCTKFKYSEYEEQPTENIAKVQEREPEILYVISEHPLVLDCVMGTLELEYDAMRVRLPSGSEVSYGSLESTSEKYWSEWNARAKSDA